MCHHNHTAHFGFSLIQVEYRAKHRKEGSHGLSMLGRPDIEMAKKAAKLSSQVMGKGSSDSSVRFKKPYSKKWFPERAVPPTRRTWALKLHV